MRIRVFLALVLLPLAAFAGDKVLRFPVRADGPKSLDPVRGSSVYESQVCDMVYECLFEYNYRARQMRLEPLLLETMPQVSDDGRVYKFKLKRGVKFRDDPCFPGGKGRELVARDVFYSWKRIADKNNQPRSWWLVKGAIKGFDEYRETQNAADKFDYDAPVEGMRIVNDHEFEVELVNPVYRFQYVLSMFQLAVVPREAVEKYGTNFGNHPVGTGPFMLREEKDWVRTQSIVLHRNPKYREAYLPPLPAGTDAVAEFSDMHGKRVPFLDRIEITFFQQDQPMWLEWLQGNLDFVQVPAENFTEAFSKRKRKLKKKLRSEGILSKPVPLLDFIFRGFNMDDPLVGGLGPKKRALRRAMHLAMDLEEFNDTFYNGINIVYDGPIPPGLEGYPPERLVANSNQGPNLERARALMAEAGYPDGKGLPEIDFWTSASANGPEQAELMRRQVARIGVRLKLHLVDFSQLSQAVHEKRAQMFSFAWSSDYPDGENNLALFYGPNESPGSNWSNYKNPEFDKLYEKILPMPPSKERTQIYVKMRDILLRDVPYMGSMARTRYYLWRPWLKNCSPTENFWTWYKYLDIQR